VVVENHLGYNKYTYTNKYTYYEGTKMAQYSKALASDFNTVRNTVATVLGTGSTTRGYGSPVASSTVSVGQTISPTEFTSLKADLDACYGHIANTTATGLVSIVSGATITWANFLTYQVAATYVDNNRDTNGGTVTNPTATSKQLPSGWGNLSTNRRATMTGTFTWPNAEAMRFFFNQGGNLRLTGSGTASTPPKDAAFATLANGVNLTFNTANYRSGTGNSQAQLTPTAPYSTGPNPSGMTVSFSAPGTTSTGFTIVCFDTGSDDGDVDGIIIDSNVGINLDFFAAPRNVSNTTGITQYIPVVTFATSWTYATS
jgi:hypothetical protein